MSPFERCTCRPLSVCSECLENLRREKAAQSITGNVPYMMLSATPPVLASTTPAGSIVSHVERKDVEP